MKEQARIYGLKDCDYDSITHGGGYHPEENDQDDSTPFITHSNESEDDGYEEGMEEFKKYVKKGKR